MGYVYVFRHGDDDQFKIGRTANVEKRRRQLQTGSPKPLTVFDTIETADAKDGEAFLHRRLAPQAPHRKELRVDATGDARGDGPGPEVPGGASAASTTELAEQRRRLLQIRAEKAQRMAGIADLTLEEERLEAAIKLAIGAARGIEGVATWQTQDGRRRFDPEWVKADDPELYAAYLSYAPKFETARFKADDPEKYAAHQVVHRIRSFHLMTDIG